jgi:hypothetical protein
MKSDPSAHQRAPIWWRVMQLLTLVVIVASVFLAAGCTPRESARQAQARQQALQQLDAAPPTWDSRAMRFDHSVVTGLDELDAPDIAGASVAAYGAQP